MEKKTSDIEINLDRFMGGNNLNEFTVRFEEKDFIFTREEVIRLLEYARNFLDKHKDDD